MTNLSAACRCLILLWAILSWSGCTPISGLNEDEEKNPHFLAGKSRLNSMDYNGAIEAFEKALEANPHSASAHFELGLLYEQRMNDFATAIYHYQKHLDLRPKSNVAEMVRQRISSCKVELAKTVAFSLVNQQVHAGLDRLTSENAALRQQVEQLKALLAQQNASREIRSSPISNSPTQDQIATATNRAVPPTKERYAPASVPVEPAPTTSVKTHLVRRGDTLASIARENGVPNSKLQAAIAKFQAANPGLDPRRLRVGQAIKIPSPLY